MGTARTPGRFSGNNISNSCCRKLSIESISGSQTGQIDDPLSPTGIGASGVREAFGDTPGTGPPAEVRVHPSEEYVGQSRIGLWTWFDIGRYHHCSAAAFRPLQAIPDTHSDGRPVR